MNAIKPENGDGDMTFSRNSAATRVNAQGLVENVQILSSNLVSNGNFSQEGVQKVSNGSFSQEGVELLSQPVNLVTDFTTNSGGVIVDADTFTTSGGGLDGIKKSFLTVGKSYKLVIEGDTTSSGFTIGSLGNSGNEYGSGFGTHYFECINSGLWIRQNTSGTTNITSFSVKEVGQDWFINGADFSLGSVLFDNSNDNIFQNKPFTVGKKYRFSFSGSGNLAYRTGYAGADGVKKDITLPHTIDIIATSDTNRIQPYGATNSSQGTLTNISVLEITDDTNLPRINYEGFSYQDSLGSEKIVNGDFATDTTWSYTTGWEISDGKANFTNISSKGMYQAKVLDANKTYKVSFDYNGTGQVGFLGTAGGGNTLKGFVNYSNGNNVIYITPTTTTSAFNIWGNWSGAFSIDNVSVKEVLGQEVVPDSGCGSWLLEPQSTNLFTESENFSNGAWHIYGGATITDNNAVSPQGIQNASKLTDVGGIYDQAPYNPNTNYVISLFAKTNTATSIVVNFVDQAAGYLGGTMRYTFATNIASVILQSANGSVVAEKEDYGNGWIRVILKFTTNVAQSYNYQAIEFQGGDGWIWGAQSEVQSYPTSYIPTSGASSTRLQDIANNSGNASLINSSEGVLYAEISALADGTNQRWISIGSGSNANRVSILFNATGRINCSVRASSTAVYDTNFNIGSQTNNTKVAIRYKNNDFAFFVNGVKVNSQLSGVLSFDSPLNELSFDSADSGSPFFGNTKGLKYYPKALADVQLEDLTTI
jgi:hypothetical protein